MGRAVAIAVLIAISVWMPASAETKCPEPGTGAVGGVFGAWASCETDGNEGDNSNTNSEPVLSSNPPQCGDQIGTANVGMCSALSAATGCPIGQQGVTIYGLVNGQLQPILNECTPIGRPAQVTPAMVLTAFQRIGIPTYSSISQPAGKTLVNFDTIFHAQAEPFTASVTLLGQRVELRIRPSSYRWEFGDGTTRITESGGAAYPSKEIVHRYAKAHTTVAHRVVITWGATYRVNGGPERPVPGTVTRAGPVTSLRISEATPVLSGEGH